jgi:hypothetical protein
MLTAEGSANAREQIVIGIGERVAGAGHDRVDAAGTHPHAEQLLTELDHIAA